MWRPTEPRLPKNWKSPGGDLSFLPGHLETDFSLWTGDSQPGLPHKPSDASTEHQALGFVLFSCHLECQGLYSKFIFP